MKKKILTFALTLIMCFTILFTVTGCDTGSPAKLTAEATKRDPSYKIEASYFAVDNTTNGKTDYDMQVERVKVLKDKLGEITYDKNGDGSIKVDEGDKLWNDFGEFVADGGMVSGFDITRKTDNGTMTLRYLDATLEITYEVN